MYFNVFSLFGTCSKNVSMQHFEQFVGKQRRDELKSVEHFVAKTVGRAV